MSTTAERHTAAGPRSSLGRDRKDVHPEVVKAMDEFVRRLDAKRAEFPPICRVLLYGSHARGDYHKDSDVDVAVIYEGPESESFLWQLGPCHSRVDVSDSSVMEAIPLLEERMAAPGLTGNPDFYRSVRRDGIEWLMPS